MVPRPPLHPQVVDVVERLARRAEECTFDRAPHAPVLLILELRDQRADRPAYFSELASSIVGGGGIGYCLVRNIDYYADSRYHT